MRLCSSPSMTERIAFPMMTFRPSFAQAQIRSEGCNLVCSISDVTSKVRKQSDCARHSGLGLGNLAQTKVVSR
jgi:hypothetical protein